MLCAFAVSLSIFGGLHVAALLFGVSLNGIAIDYCLQYVSARFGADAGTPSERLRRVLPESQSASYNPDRIRDADAGAISGTASTRGILRGRALGSFVTSSYGCRFLIAPSPCARRSHLALSECPLGVLGRRALSALAMERYCIDWNYVDCRRDQAPNR